MSAAGVPAGRPRAGLPASLPANAFEAAFAALGLGAIVSYAALWLRPLWLGDFRPFDGGALSQVPILGADWTGLGKYVAGVAIPVVLYVAALLILPRLRPRAAWTIAVLVAVVAPLVLLYTYPALAADVFDYLMIGRLLAAYHVNPFTHTANFAPSDPYYLPVGWKDLQSVYGPAWVLMMGAIVGLCGKSAVAALLLTKLAAVLAHWAVAALVFLLARRLNPRAGLFAFVAYAWNPLVLVHFAVDGHNDSFMLLFVLASLYFALDRRWELSFMSLMGAALIKFVPLVLFPLLIWRARHDREGVLFGLAMAALLAVVFFAPFWAGAATFAGVRDQASRMTTSPAAVAGFFVPNGWLRPVALALFAAGYAVVLRSRLNLIEGAYAVLLLYLMVLSFWTKAWYFTWPIALGAVLGGAPFWVSVPGMAGLFVANIFGGWGWVMDWWRWSERWGQKAMEIWLTSASLGGWVLALLAAFILRRARGRRPRLLRRLEPAGRAAAPSAPYGPPKTIE